MSQIDTMHTKFPRCPICKSTDGYKSSVFYPLVACKSCKSEWALYEHGMELRATSKTSLIAELLNKTYSFDFWKGELKPQITGRIFAPMNCIGGGPEQVEPSKGYIIFRTEDTIAYVGEDKEHRKVETEIPLPRFKKAVIKDRKKIAMAVGILVSPVAGMAVDRNNLVIHYRDSFGDEQRRIFDFHDDKTAKQLVNLLDYTKARARGG